MMAAVKQGTFLAPEAGHPVSALASFDPKSPFRKHTIVRRKPRDDDVVIAIQFCGICHSDLHTVKDEWGGCMRPMVPGHEIAGVVTSVGKNVKKYKVGDRVGVGCMVDGCDSCESCKRDLANYCTNGAVFTYNGRDYYDKTTTLGGYSKEIVVRESFVLRIPDNLPLDKAAPLLCAGITLYSPLRHWKCGPGKKVGVVGLGGLGASGVIQANAMGAEVTVISTSPNKKDDAMKLGAKHFLVSKDPEQMKSAAGTLDLIVNTVSVDMDMGPYINLLKLDGTIVQLGVPPKPLQVNASSLIGKRRTFGGSLIGGVGETQEMLDFWGKHNIHLPIEVIAPSQVDEAYERMLRSDVRYRFVIDMSKL